jgi:inhibitor of cysteine peptidase
MKTISVLLILGLLLAGCQGLDVNPSIGTYNERAFLTGDLKPLQFSSETDLKNMLSTQSSNYNGRMVFGGGMSMVARAEIAMASDSKVASGVDFSQTNNQVASVDEADIVKTDGEYIYKASGNVVYIVKAYPVEDGEVIEHYCVK